MKRYIFAGGGIVLAAIVFAFSLNSPPASGGYPIIEHAAPAKPAPAPTPGVAALPKPPAEVSIPEGAVPCATCASGWRIAEPGEAASLPGQPIRRTAAVARVGGGAALRAGRVGLRVGSAPARFIFRRCRGGC